MDKNDFESIREYNEIYKKGRQISKASSCMICGKICSSFCNSHTLPQMVLKNILNDGKLNTAFWLLGDKNNPDVLKQNKGLNNAGVFHLICNDCDSKIFNEYEQEDIFKKPFPDEILNLITLKSSLYMYYKYQIQRYADSILCKDIENNEILDNNNEKYAKEFKEDIEECKKILNNKEDKSQHYKILFWRKLNYKVPLATQTCYGLSHNFEGKIVSGEPMVYVLICPFEEYSTICLYSKNDESVINKLAFPQNASLQKKLSLINNLIIVNTEDYYVSKELEKRLDEKKKQELRSMSYSLEYANPFSMSKQASYMKDSFNYINLLLEKYKES